MSWPGRVSSQSILPDRASWTDFKIPTLQINVDDESTMPMSYRERPVEVSQLGTGE